MSTTLSDTGDNEPMGLKKGLMQSEAIEDSGTVTKADGANIIKSYRQSDGDQQEKEHGPSGVTQNQVRNTVGEPVMKDAVPVADRSRVGGVDEGLITSTPPLESNEASSRSDTTNSRVFPGAHYVCSPFSPEEWQALGQSAMFDDHEHVSTMTAPTNTDMSVVEAQVVSEDDIKLQLESLMRERESQIVSQVRDEILQGAVRADAVVLDKHLAMIDDEKQAQAKTTKMCIAAILVLMVVGIALAIIMPITIKRGPRGGGTIEKPATLTPSQSPTLDPLQRFLVDTFNITVATSMLSTFHNLVVSAGLENFAIDEVQQDLGGVTLIIPSNAAFTAWNNTLPQEKLNRSQLRQLLLYHKCSRPVSDVYVRQQPEQQLEVVMDNQIAAWFTIANNTSSLPVTPTGQALLINGAQVLYTAQIGRSFVHVVSQVLVAPSVGDMLEILTHNTNYSFSKYLQLVSYPTNLTSLISQTPNLTVLCPLDNAFDSADSVVKNLFNADWYLHSQTFVKNHLAIDATILPSQTYLLHQFYSLGGQTSFIHTESGHIHVGAMDAEPLQLTDVPTRDNGSVYGIMTVLEPDWISTTLLSLVEGFDYISYFGNSLNEFNLSHMLDNNTEPLTVLAPIVDNLPEVSKYLLKGYVIPGNWYLSELQTAGLNGVTALNHQNWKINVNGSSTFIGNAKIVYYNNLARNGVLHFLDGPLKEQG